MRAMVPRGRAYVIYRARMSSHVYKHMYHSQVARALPQSRHSVCSPLAPTAQVALPAYKTVRWAINKKVLSRLDTIASTYCMRRSDRQGHAETMIGRHMRTLAAEARTAAWTEAHFMPSAPANARGLPG